MIHKGDLLHLQLLVHLANNISYANILFPLVNFLYEEILNIENFYIDFHSISPCHESFFNISDTIHSFLVQISL